MIAWYILHKDIIKARPLKNNRLEVLEYHLGSEFNDGWVKEEDLVQNVLNFDELHHLTYTFLAPEHTSLSAVKVIARLHRNLRQAQKEWE